MGRIRSKIPQLAAERQLKAEDLMRASKGLSYNAAYRAMRGETNFTLSRVAALCEAFGTHKIDDLFEYVEESDESGLEGEGG